MNETNAPETLQPQLSAIETRVLGALMEKQLTTPDVYPLTLNSLVLACNQKTSREPISNYTSGEIKHCVRELAERKLIDIDYGARADRYAQRLSRVLGIDKCEQTLLNVLLLRGAQTTHELLTRTQRMHDFENDQNVEEALNHLCEKFTPLLQRIPRQIGQREDRFVHLLSGAPDLTAVAATKSVNKSMAPNEMEERLDLLEKQVFELEKKVGLLMAMLASEP